MPIINQRTKKCIIIAYEKCFQLASDNKLNNDFLQSFKNIMEENCHIKDVPFENFYSFVYLIQQIKQQPNSSSENQSISPNKTVPRPKSLNAYNILSLGCETLQKETKTKLEKIIQDNITDDFKSTNDQTCKSDLLKIAASKAITLTYKIEHINNFLKENKNKKR